MAETNCETPALNRSSKAWLPGWLLAALLVAFTFLAYIPAIRGGYVWDDESWTTKISSLLQNFAGLRSLWIHPTALQQYYPLTGTSFWLDYQLWGFHPLPSHLENVFFHCCAALLFVRLLKRLSVPGAWLAGALFALHPVMVESAGWITERKNVLSLTLYLGSVLAYGRFADFWRTKTGAAADSPASAGPRARQVWLILSLLLFLAALLAKTTAFSLPAALILIGWWKRGEIRWKRDVLPLIPFFALSTGLCLVTAWLENHSVGARGPEWDLSFPQRCIIAGRVFWFYIAKLAWPANLSFVYPRWNIDASSPAQWLYPATAVAALLGLWLARNRIGRGPATAVFFFAGTLFPVLGFMNAYFMRYSFVCDHWVYLSSLGLIALAAAPAAALAERWHATQPLVGSAAVLLALLAALTWQQGGMYSDLETLWKTSLSKNPDAWLPHNNLGNLYLYQGRLEQALAELREGLKIKPSSSEGHYNLGNAFMKKGDLAGAIAEFKRATGLQSGFVKALYNLALAYSAAGRKDEAIVEFQKALEYQPDSADIRYNLGVAFLGANRLDEAIPEFQKTLELRPASGNALNNLGVALLQKGRAQEAIATFQKALKLEPENMMALNNLVRLLVQTGRGAEAVADLDAFLKLQPRNIPVLNDLAWFLATSPDGSLRDGNKAIELAERADRLSGGSNRAILNTLAAAYAEAGRFPEAIAVAQKARQLASAQNDPEEVSFMKTRIEDYQAGVPFRDAGLGQPAKKREAP